MATDAFVAQQEAFDSFMLSYFKDGDWPHRTVKGQMQAAFMAGFIYGVTRCANGMVDKKENT